VKKPPKVTLEKKVQPKIIADVKGMGGLACKVLPFNVIGIPDLIMALPSRNGHPGTGLFFVEVKKDDGDTSKIQDARIAWLQSLGIKVYVVYGIEGWVALRKQLLPQQ